LDDNTLINIAGDDVASAIITNRTLISLGYLAAAVGFLAARPLFMEYYAKESIENDSC
jgi:hypothetical protein